MSMFVKRTILCLALGAAVFVPSQGAKGQEHNYDYTTDKVLNVVATAHLDTQWRWTIQRTINEYILATLRRNFFHFDLYPNYTFSFEGAFRYMLAEEYYPRDFDRLKRYIEQGRWKVCGSSVDAGDVNVPSPEAIMRNILYGNGYFRREFGVSSVDIFLPDCFGFGYALPSIAAHCGLNGFSTQKLTWGSSVGIPFDIGVWEGVDGSEIVAALNPDPYVSSIRSDLSNDKRWIETVEKQGRESGLYVGYKYFGVGDVGGAPDDETVSWLEKSIAGTGPLKVVSAPADKLFRDITPAQMKRLPRYRGELLMTTHGTGCYTSQNAMKRWNRKNELLADAVERASVVGAQLGGIVYPREKLRENWVSFIWHTFHDDLTGTSIPEAYEFSWNDEIIALNRSATMLEDAVGAVSRALDTDVEGQPLVVYNPIAMHRADIVEAEVPFPGGAPRHVRVFGPDGREVVSQVADVSGDTVTVVFLAEVEPVGFAVYDVRPSDSPCALESGVTASETALSNGRYTVRIDADGDVASITDRAENRELLESPIRLALFENESKLWPAWEITYETVAADPVEYAANPVSVRVIEKGPARVSVEITRKTGDTTITQTVCLAANGDRVEFDHVIDWRTKGRLLKAVFPLAVSNEKATYDLGLGVIERGINTENLYEVPAQQWADITGTDGSYGVTVMNDCLYGWDKPDRNTLRLTMIHTPKPEGFGDQAMQDIGRHRMSFAVSGHKGSWSDGSSSVHEAARFNQPLLAFRTGKHAALPGTGGALSFLTAGSAQFAVRALKLAEESDEIIVRVVETEGRNLSGGTLAFAHPVVSAREVNGAEDPFGPATVRDGALMFDLGPFQPKTFAVGIGRSDIELSKPSFAPLEMPFDIDVVSHDDDRRDGGMDSAGHTFSGDLLPETLVCEGIPFTMGPSEPGMANAVVCRGQTIDMPVRPRLNDYNKLYIIAAAADGDTRGTFMVDGTPYEIGVQDYSGFIGQWDNRLVNGQQVDGVFQVLPAYIKRDRLAWVGTHRHAPDGANEAYVFTYLYRYAIDIPGRAAQVTLPDNENIRVFAMTAAVNLNDTVSPAHLLYDDARATSVSLDTETRGGFIGSITVGLVSNPAGADIRYTLDGSEPTEHSRRYTDNISVTDNMTLKAKAFAEGFDDVRMMVVDFVKLEPRTPVKTGRLSPGLSYRTYHGQWDKLPDFRRLKPVANGVAAMFAIPDGTRDDHFGVTWDGYIEVPADGVYTFSTMSDDGSRLYLDGQLLVDSDGLHGPQEILGTNALLAGKHRIRVEYFENSGGESIEVFWEGPGIRKGLIGAEVLFRD